MSRSAASTGSKAFDVFNGDADGICALHQLRLAEPRDATLVTGVKRDIELLQRVPSERDVDVTVLDISLDANVSSLARLLEAGGRVNYFDHHSARQAFAHPKLDFFWDDSPAVCTSILVDRYLRGRFRQWAIVAAFGDNLRASARRLAATIGLSENHVEALDELGRMLNYNAYGDSTDDLHVAPQTLYRAVHQFVDPLEFIASSPYFRLLADGYSDDAIRAEALVPERQWAEGELYVLPDAPWARRISGDFANRLASQRPTASFAVLTAKPDGSYAVSVRSGSPEIHTAHGLCGKFPSGGGRKAAAGINCLPVTQLDEFIAAFAAYFVVGRTPATDAAGPPDSIHEPFHQEENSR